MGLQFDVECWAALAPGLTTRQQWQEWFVEPSPLAHDFVPELGWMPGALRRRVSPLGRAALNVLATCQPQESCPVVFASRHGDLGAIAGLLSQLHEESVVSPMGFSLSVHNAAMGVYSMARSDRTTTTCVAANVDLAEAACCEALGWLSAGVPRVLVVCCADPVPPPYVPQAGAEQFRYAWACLLRRVDINGISLTPAAGEPAAVDHICSPSLRALAFLRGAAGENCVQAPDAICGGAMIDRTFRIWRVFATGLSFSVFGIGGLLLLILGIPLLYVLFPQKELRQKATRQLVRSFFWLFVRLMWLLGILRFRFVHGERLSRPGLIIVANHPTLLDVVFLISMVPNATCIVRAGLSNNPFTYAPVRLAGYVCNDWGLQLVDDCVAALRGGSSLVVFPEGTRSHGTWPQRWHRGAANIALKADVPLTPVRIGCEPLTLRKGEPWWQVPVRPMRYSIEVLDDLPVMGRARPEGRESETARNLTEQLKERLIGQVGSNAGA